MSAPAGVWLVDKPVGPTSHDIVAEARRALGTRKIGHTGTLDPFASGLLILCVGWATRISQYLLGLDKRYRATAHLGVRTDTDDREGALIAESEGWRTLSDDQMDDALRAVGERTLQTPPIYSAKKRSGVAAHRRARAGEAVELEPAPIRIRTIDRLKWDPPALTFDVACSSGTYIRAIARDLGEELGVGGHLVELRRTEIGSFDVSRAVAPEALGTEPEGSDAFLRPTEALAHLPRVELGESETVELRHGRAIPCADLEDAATVRGVEGDRLIAIGEVSEGEFRPRKVFPDGD